MKLKLLTGLITLFLLTTSVLYGSSVFSFDGMPLQDYNNDVYGLGMGETGIADTYRKNTGFFNPSLGTTLNQVYFSTGISAGNYYFKDSKDSFRTDGIYFPYFNAIVPLHNHRIGFNYAAYLSGNADVYSPERQWEEGTYSEINRVRSYIYKGSVLYSNKNSLVNFGFSLNYLLGHRFRYWSRQYSKTGAFENPKYERNETFGNFGFSTGINKTLGNVSLGAMYQSPVELKGSKELIAELPLEKTYGSKNHRFDMEDSYFNTPHHIGLGLVWRIKNIFRAASDIHYELWSETDTYEDSQDTYKMALGLAYEPQWGNDKWYQKIPLRAGLYYRTLPFKVNDSYPDEIAGTFGVTIPLQAPNSQIDLSLKYLIRGDTDDNIYSDESIVFSIGLSGFDFFRSRPKKVADREIPEAELDTFRY